MTSHLVTTTTGIAIRQTALDIGVVHFLLTCLGLLSHHKPRNNDRQYEATMEALNTFNNRCVSFDGKVKGTLFVGQNVDRTSLKFLLFNDVCHEIN